MPASSSSLSVLAPVIGVGASPPVPLSAMESIRLVQALKTVPDPRRRRGRRHGLQSVLLLAVQAVEAGEGRGRPGGGGAPGGGNTAAGPGGWGGAPPGPHVPPGVGAPPITPGRGPPAGPDVPPGAGRRRYPRGGGRADQGGDRPPGPLPAAATGGHDRR